MSDSARGSFSQLHAGAMHGALAACGVQPGVPGWMGSGSSSASVARYLTDSLSLLTSVTGVSKFGTYSTTAVLEY